MTYQMPSRSCVFLYLLLLLGTRGLLAGPPAEKVIRQIAARNLSHFLLLKSLKLLKGPFFLAIDGPPGVGKSSLATPLQQFIKEAVEAVGSTLVLGTFRQDDFLRSKADRCEAFALEHGEEGISGNCDGREYRWEELLECVKNVHCAKKYTGYVYTSGATPDIQGPKLFDYSELDILVFDGTHSTGHQLFTFMHSTVYLGADPELVRFNRLERGFVRNGRTWFSCEKIADIAESQYPIYLNPNSRRTQYLFRMVSREPLPPVSESQKNSWPEITRELEVVYDPFACMTKLSEAQKQAAEKLRQSGVLGQVDGMLEETVFAAPAFFWSQLADMFQAGGFRLIIPERDNSCFFTSLANAYPLLGIRDRAEAIALLKKLQKQLQLGLLTEVQQQVINEVDAILAHEIEFISHPQHWGGFTTMMYLWAALLGSDNPPTEPVYLVLRLGDKIVILALNPDGAVTELEALPAYVNSLVYDGGTHWMWAEPVAGTIPADNHCNGEDEEDSGFNSPTHSLYQLHTDPISKMKKSLNGILFNLIEERLSLKLFLTQ